MKKYKVYTRSPQGKPDFDLVYEGEYGDDVVMTYDEMADSALEHGTYWMPNTEFIIILGSKAIMLKTKLEYKYT